MPLVVVADDDGDIRELVRFSLERAGLDVVTVSDGDAALVACAEQRPAVALLDVAMAGRSGLEVCRTLRQTAPEVAVILLSARAEDAEVAEGYAAGAVDYVVKPFSPRELATRVQGALARTQR